MGASLQRLWFSLKVGNSIINSYEKGSQNGEDQVLKYCLMLSIRKFLDIRVKVEIPR